MRFRSEIGIKKFLKNHELHIDGTKIGYLGTSQLRKEDIDIFSIYINGKKTFISLKTSVSIVIENDYTIDEFSIGA